MLGSVFLLLCGCQQANNPAGSPSKVVEPRQKIVWPQTIALGADYAQAKTILAEAGFTGQENPPRDVIVQEGFLLCEYGIAPHTSLNVSVEKSSGKIVGMTREENSDQPKGERSWVKVSEITVTPGRISTTAAKTWPAPY